jgi:hypothetical protein
MTKEPHLVHKHHKVSKCSERGDPMHRAEYLHTKLPDYLIPCRRQNDCPDKSIDHRIRYFHGETIPSFKSNFF